MAIQVVPERARGRPVNPGFGPVSPEGRARALSGIVNERRGLWTDIVARISNWTGGRNRGRQSETSQMAAGRINAAHNGTILNPYRFGKGSSKWPEYTGMSQVWKATGSVTGWTLHSGIAMDLL